MSFRPDLWADAIMKGYQKGLKITYFARVAQHAQIVENLKPFALLGNVHIWQCSNDVEQKSTIGLQRKGENFWAMTDSVDENEVKSLLTRVAAGTPARSIRD